MKMKSLLNGTTVVFALLPGLSHAQTIITGPNISGTWPPSGSPYIVTSDCTVPSGQSLIIQPGTVVWIGQGVSIIGNGMISAVGTPAQRITFQAPVSSQTWNTIVAQGTAETNQFKYCDFVNATTALTFQQNSVNSVCFSTFQNVTNGIRMLVSANDWTQTTKVVNCTFSNCMYQAIYGEAYGNAGSGWQQYGTIDATIKNNSFWNAVVGCQFNIFGHHYYGQWGNRFGYGYGKLKIQNNIFGNNANTAISLTAGSDAGSSFPALIDNVVVNAGNGVVTQDPWDARVQSSLFINCTNAVKAAGSLSRTVSYNGFYGNATNFTGYPSTYGMVILANRNGTPSDVLYNIFQDPKFVATNDFHLLANSPAIDAGTPDWAYSDMCFPPSQGTAYPDLGAYGGPDAANWLDTVPKLPVVATTTYSSNVTRVNWGAIPRSEYVVQYLTNFVTVGTNKWLNYTNGDVLATDKPTSLVVATNQSLPKMFFRVQSLGRPAGN